MTDTLAPVRQAADGEPVDVARTTAAVVGGGPAGMVLALLLARAGVEVTLLEAHGDFDRQFRGDSLHPSVLEIMDQLGLADRLHRLPHTRVPSIPIDTPEGPLVPVDLRVLRTPFPYIMLVHQARFLEFLAEEAARYPTFRLVRSANVRRLVVEGGVVRGARWRGPGGWHEVRAAVTIAADGRNSKVRALAGLEPVGREVPMDTLWFRLPRRPGDPPRSWGRLAGGRFLGFLQREDHWQVTASIVKGSYPHVRAEGLAAFRSRLAATVPEFADRLLALEDWSELSLLSVRADRLPRWHRPGLLLIGDAAHAMSPAAGVGINVAIQDAVVAANVLAAPLRARQRRGGEVPESLLAAVQRRREVPVRIIQAVQRLAERPIAAAMAGRPAVPPLARRVVRAPGVRGVLARFLGLGVWRVPVRT